MVVFDSVRDELSIVTPVRPHNGADVRAAWESAQARLDAIVAVLESPLAHAAPAADPHLLATPPTSNTPQARYLDMVERAKEYIRAGDIFQVVLSQRFTAPFQLPAFALYRALRRVNPAPFLCYLDFGGFQIVCSSPEILVRVRDGKVTIRPIAGTRRRGKTPAEDQALADELLADPEGARRTSDAARSRPQRCRPRRADRQRRGHRTILRRALQPRDAHRLERGRQARSRA